MERYLCTVFIINYTMLFRKVQLKSTSGNKVMTSTSIFCNNQVGTELQQFFLIFLKVAHVIILKKTKRYSRAKVYIPKQSK